MNKGLKALKEYRTQQTGVNVYADELLDIIEKELKDKEKFEELVNMDLDLFMKAVDIKGLLEIEKQYKKLEYIFNHLGIKYKKQCEILEIIKNKQVDILSFCSYSFILYNFNLEPERQLTKEEYNLIEEWLNDGKRK